MATAIWTGSLSLGLVVVPVRLHPAIRKKAVRFHEVDRSGRRVRHMRVAEPDLASEASGRALETEWVPRFEAAARPLEFLESANREEFDRGFLQFRERYGEAYAHLHERTLKIAADSEAVDLDALELDGIAAGRNNSTF